MKSRISGIGTGIVALAAGLGLSSNAYAQEKPQARVEEPRVAQPSKSEAVQLPLDFDFLGSAIKTFQYKRLDESGYTGVLAVRELADISKMSYTVRGYGAGKDWHLSESELASIDANRKEFSALETVVIASLKGINPSESHKALAILENGLKPYSHLAEGSIKPAVLDVKNAVDYALNAASKMDVVRKANDSLRAGYDKFSKSCEEVRSNSAHARLATLDSARGSMTKLAYTMSRLDIEGDITDTLITKVENEGEFRTHTNFRTMAPTLLGDVPTVYLAQASKDGKARVDYLKTAEAIMRKVDSTYEVVKNSSFKSR